MYLTRMRLNIAKRDTLRALSCHSWFHGAVEDALSRTNDRKLWRIDKLGGEYYLIVVSREKPDMSSAARQFGYPDDTFPWETLDYDRFLASLGKGTRWHFRLTANPSMRSRKDRTIYAHAGVNNQTKWLMERAQKNGFAIKENEFRIVESRWLSFKKNLSENKRVTILSVTYEGIMEITDSELVSKALVTGIGRGKAYGQGMMTLMRAS